MAERNEIPAAAQNPLTVARMKLVWEDILGNDMDKTVKVNTDFLPDFRSS
jgi:hypothetical protein